MGLKSDRIGQVMTPIFCILRLDYTTKRKHRQITLRQKLVLIFKTHRRFCSFTLKEDYLLVSVKVWGSYNYKLGVLSKEVTIIKKENNSKVYIDEQSEVKSYLEQYGITANDLDSYYDEIVNQKVLKDWCTIYDSKYSPSNYGDVKIETQWENW